MDIHEKLNIPEGLHGLSLVKEAVRELRFQISIRDDPEPMTPDQIRLHQRIQEIMSFTDDILYMIDMEIEEQERGEKECRTMRT